VSRQYYQTWTPDAASRQLFSDAATTIGFEPARLAFTTSRRYAAATEHICPRGIYAAIFQ